MHGADTSAQSAQKLQTGHPDLDMETYLMHGKDGQIYILHDTPFSKKLSWVEYNPHNGKIAFVMEDGGVMDFGIPVGENFKDAIIAQKTVAVAYVRNGAFIEGYNYPLIKYK